MIKFCTRYNLLHTQQTLVSIGKSGNIKTKTAFSLVEMLMALLVASLLMAAMAPVITRKMDEHIDIKGSMDFTGANVKTHEIEFDSSECNQIKTDADGSEYCEGEFIVPNGYNGIMKVTVIGAGGGGGSAPTAGYTEYTTAGTKSFTVPYGVNDLEITLVEGGAGGGAGWVDTDTIYGYAWTHSGTLNRSYVSTSIVPESIVNKKVSGDSVSASYAHGEATLNKDDLKYAAGGKVFVTMAAGGGGGGRGFYGTGGGGGAAYKNQAVNISKNTDYKISVGAGGKGHACNACGSACFNGTLQGGCGGSASKFGNLLTTAGGGGGVWSNVPKTAILGEENSLTPISKGLCAFTDYSIAIYSGGRGGQPGGSDGADIPCDTTMAANKVPGTQGGLSLFGTGGIFSCIMSTATRHGQGYGAGGCGGGGSDGAPPCSQVTDFAGSEFTGNGAPGFVAATWYNYANGGGGGGGASIIPKHKLKVVPGETLSLTVGKGGAGGKAAILTGTNTGNKAPTDGENGYPSTVSRGSNVLIRTSVNTPTACGHGSCGGDETGRCKIATTSRDGDNHCNAGWVAEWTGSSFDHSTTIYDAIYAANTKYPGYSTEAGYMSGNLYHKLNYTGTLTPENTGGKGGQTVIDNQKFCTPGAGSTTLNAKGSNASGYGGCGGGGGYGIADGGDGAPGYAKITWNKYWNASENKNKLIENIAGGGGASGNIMKYTISVISGQTIKVRIGKGGKGAYIVNNRIVPAQNGGTTIFGDSASGEVKAGGGKSGTSPYYNTLLNTLVSGGGGNVSDLCGFGSRNYFNNPSYCTKGKAGNNPEGTRGGIGANLTAYGTGGGSGVQDTGDNANGKNAEGLGSGGGGAAIREFGAKVEPTNVLNNPNTGGNGTNGKILLEWWE